MLTSWVCLLNVVSGSRRRCGTNGQRLEAVQRHASALFVSEKYDVLSDVQTKSVGIVLIVTTKTLHMVSMYHFRQSKRGRRCE